MNTQNQHTETGLETAAGGCVIPFEDDDFLLTEAGLQAHFTPPEDSEVPEVGPFSRRAYRIDNQRVELRFRYQRRDASIAFHIGRRHVTVRCDCPEACTELCPLAYAVLVEAFTGFDGRSFKRFYTPGLDRLFRTRRTFVRRRKSMSGLFYKLEKGLEAVFLPEADHLADVHPEPAALLPVENALHREVSGYIRPTRRCLSATPPPARSGCSRKTSKTFSNRCSHDLACIMSWRKKPQNPR